MVQVKKGGGGCCDRGANPRHAASLLFNCWPHVLLMNCRHVLELPVRNSTRVDLIEYDADLDGFKVTVSSSNSSEGQQQQQEREVLYARKIVLATGIQVSERCCVDTSCRVDEVTLCAAAADSLQPA